MRGWVVLVAVAAGCGESGSTPVDALVGTDVPCTVSLSATPAQLDLGTVSAFGQKTATVTLANTGTCPTQALSHALGGADAGALSIASSTCDEKLAPGASCMVDIRFRPTAVGTYHAFLTAHGAGAQVTVPIVANATPFDGWTLAGAPFDFGSVGSSTTSAAHRFTVTNTGSGPIFGIDVARSGTGASEFVTVANTCVVSVLPAGASCQVDVAFAPTSAGLKSASLDVMSPSYVTLSAPLTGTGGTAVLAITPSLHDYGLLCVGQSRTATYTVTNTGTATSGALASAVAGKLAITTDGCAGTTLAPGASCTIDTVVTGTGIGSSTGTLTTTASPGGSAVATAVATVATCNGFSVSPNPFAFADTATGTTSATRTFTLTNTGGSPTGTVAVALGGTAPSQFHIDADSCTGVILSAGATCTVDASFRPTSTGAKSATLTMIANPGGTTQASLSGNGVAGQLAFTPSQHDFGHVPPGATPPFTFTLVNNTTSPTATLTATITGTNSSEFLLGADTCTGTSLAIGATCTIDVRFSPTNAGAHAAALGAGGATASLVGSAFAPPGIAIVPSAIAFGDAAVGTSTASQRFTINWGGSVPTGALGVQLAGANPNEVHIDADTCTGVQLQPSGSCTIDVSFRPTSTGTKAATLIAVANPGGTVQAALSGTGTP